MLAVKQTHRAQPLLALDEVGATFPTRYLFAFWCLHTVTCFSSKIILYPAGYTWEQ